MLEWALFREVRVPERPLISIVVVNWNGGAFLEECLHSLEDQTWEHRELLVVDNGSTDASLDILDTWESRSWVRVIRLSQNTGFAAANNRAFREARGEWIALLNNDAVARPDWLERLMTHACREDRTGMLGGKILFYDRPAVIDKVCHLLYPDGLNRGRGCGEKDDGRFDRVEEVIWPDGCAALYHRDLIDETGGFDESFFAYGDDADLGMRARLLGWRALYVPEAVVLHRHSATSGAYSPLKAMLVERNRLWLALKDFPFLLLVQNPFWTLLRFGFQALGAMGGVGAAGKFAGEHGRLRLLATLGWAYLSAAKGLPRILSERRRVMRGKRLKGRDVRALVRRFQIGVRELSLRD